MSKIAGNGRYEKGIPDSTVLRRLGRLTRGGTDVYIYSLISTCAMRCVLCTERSAGVAIPR